MLRVWLDSGPQPPTAVREPVCRVLLGWLGDPRLPSSAHRWAMVGEQEAALMLRWLTRASLDLFFKLIDRHALDEHWRYRHAFWLAYLEKGKIDDAWLALGARTHNEADAVDKLGGAYARLKEGDDTKQSAILLRIGPLVISEFTHTGKLRVWPAEWRNAPQLRRPSYKRKELMGKCLSFPPNPDLGRGGDSSGGGLSHFGSDYDYWQGSAAELIRRRAGIGITPAEWQPQ
jgi:hypothetical protein